MLLPLKPICNARNAGRDGASPIYLQYCYSATNRTLLNTGIRIPPDCWNSRLLCVTKKLPETFGDYKFLNDELVRQIRLAEDLIRYAADMESADKGSFVKNSFSPSRNILALPENKELAGGKQKSVTRITNNDIYYQFDEYIKSKERKVSKATLCVYKNVKAHLLGFEIYRNKKITFESLDFTFYEDFVNYLTYEHIHIRRQTPLVGLRLNTIGKTIKHLRVFIKDRVKRKIIPAIDLSDFKIPEEESDAIYLSQEEIIRIYEADLSGHHHLIEYRDLFVLGCLTGLRFSDFSTLKPEDLKHDMLYKKQVKSDHWVIIPLREEAKLIFTRQFKDKIAQLTNPEFNRHIKTIGKLAGINRTIKFTFKKGNRDISTVKPKYDFITSHTARRSFCTNEFLAGTPVELIMRISGHKNVKDFYKYIRITNEEAARKIKDLWLSRNDMKLAK